MTNVLWLKITKISRIVNALLTNHRTHGEQREMKQTGAEFLSLIADKIICGFIRTGPKIWPTEQDE